jgi:hypothetical protein
MSLFSRQLLDDQTFVITAGWLGSLRVRSKWIGVERNVSAYERRHLARVQSLLKGSLLEPGRDVTIALLREFADVVLRPGDDAWRIFFVESTPEHIADRYTARQLYGDRHESSDVGG